MTEAVSRRENPDFLQFLYKSLWSAAGASDEHAEAVARAVSIGDRMGKLTQGMGVLDAIFITLETGDLDIKAEPQCVAEGPTWVLFDGKQSSGYWTLTRAVNAAIDKAKEHAVAIAMARNHNDARGLFCLYVTGVGARHVCNGDQQQFATGVALGEVWKTNCREHHFARPCRPASSSHWSAILLA